MKDCLFCKIIEGKMPSEKVYEDDNVYAFLDITPNNHGHTLVIPKAHHDNIYKMSDEDVSNVFKTVKKLASTIKNSLNSDGINIAMNNDAAAGQVVFHAHVHIIPRYSEDGFEHWKGTPYPEGEITKVAEKIKNAL